uniref:C-type lectin domain-containing protein n=1 Tax=Neovison vison TaxID=452646 RepID=A0A8C7BFC9_NEOVI
MERVFEPSFLKAAPLSLYHSLAGAWTFSAQSQGPALGGGAGLGSGWSRGADSVDGVHSFWKEGEPNNHGDEDCVELYNEGWNDNRCSVENFWTCEKPSSPCPGS